MEDGRGRWETTPCPTPELAFEICKRIEPLTSMELKRALFGAKPFDQLTYRAQAAIELGFKRFREQAVKSPDS